MVLAAQGPIIQRQVDNYYSNLTIALTFEGGYNIAGSAQELLIIFDLIISGQKMCSTN